MSLAIDVATVVHSKQVNAAVKAQDLYINFAQKFAETVRTVGEKAVPDALSRPLNTLSAPLAKRLGTPTELASHVAQSALDWVGVEHRFGTVFLEAVMPVSSPEATIDPA